jgi:hypothetical protein
MVRSHLSATYLCRLVPTLMTLAFLSFGQTAYMFRLYLEWVSINSTSVLGCLVHADERLTLSVRRPVYTPTTENPWTTSTPRLLPPRHPYPSSPLQSLQQLPMPVQPSLPNQLSFVSLSSCSSSILPLEISLLPARSIPSDTLTTDRACPFSCFSLLFFGFICCFPRSYGFISAR